MTPAAGGEAKLARLPALREELKLIPGRKNADGEQSWRIYDPLQHRYIEVDGLTVEMLALWHSVNDAEALRTELEETRNVSLSIDSINELIKFAHDNYLTADPLHGEWKSLSGKSGRAQQGWAKWLLHNYLYFRVPLAKPQEFLVSTLPAVTFLFQRRVHIALACFGVTGIYLVSRQWDQFVNTFQHFFTVSGAMWFALILFIVKGLHELGHAYTAVRLGCQVPAMGVAFMMMTPMLYTDVTDAWRLTSRRKRMAIDFAGIAVELMIACLATFFWSFLPEGKLKSLAFLLATSSLLMSLVINLSPFMRFDGYFILADLVGIPNLQPRAFAVARWRLRETLFAIKAPCPEDMPPAKLFALSAYAWATWIYRFLLYLGIAALVYAYFFKALGVILFVVEVVVFLVNPVLAEIREWGKMKPAIVGSRRSFVSAGVALAVLAAAVLPWSTRVEIPVVVEPFELARVYPPRPAKVSAVHAQRGATVAAGTLLVSLTSDDLEHEIRVVRTEMARIKAKLARLTADDVDRENSAISRRELAVLTAKFQGLQKEKSELEIKAPIAGTLIEFNSELHPGRTISQKDMIVLIGGQRGLAARGYVAEKDLWRLKNGDKGRLVPENGLRQSFQISLRDISLAGARQIEIADLASVNGGKIAVQPGSKHQLVPIAAHYAVTLEIEGPIGNPDTRFRGVAHIKGKAESFAAQIGREIARVLIRESGA